LLEIESVTEQRIKQIAGELFCLWTTHTDGLKNGNSFLLKQFA